MRFLSDLRAPCCFAGAEVAPDACPQHGEHADPEHDVLTQFIDDLRRDLRTAYPGWEARRS